MVVHGFLKMDLVLAGDTSQVVKYHQDEDGSCIAEVEYSGEYLVRLQEIDLPLHQQPKGNFILRLRLNGKNLAYNLPFAYGNLKEPACFGYNISVADKAGTYSAFRLAGGALPTEEGATLDGRVEVDIHAAIARQIPVACCYNPPSKRAAASAAYGDLNGETTSWASAEGNSTCDAKFSEYNYWKRGNLLDTISLSYRYSKSHGKSEDVVAGMLPVKQAPLDPPTAGGKSDESVVEVQPPPDYVPGPTVQPTSRRKNRKRKRMSSPIPAELVVDISGLSDDD